jgi:hypothetical protein
MSRNISGGPPISVFLGRLNYQIEHHLFPSMARPQLRKAQPLVAAYGAAQGIPYTRTTLRQSYRIVIGYLNTVGLRGKGPFPVPPDRSTPRPLTLPRPESCSLRAESAKATASLSNSWTPEARRS